MILYNITLCKEGVFITLMKSYYRLNYILLLVYRSYAPIILNIIINNKYNRHKMKKNSRYNSIAPGMNNTAYLNFPTISNENPYGSSRGLESTKFRKSFLERNYFPAVNKAKKSISFKTMSQTELNSFYYMLKRYFNEINHETSHNELAIESLKEQNKKLSKNIRNIENSKDICVNGKEKISIINAKEEPEEIGEKIRKLEHEKSEIEGRKINEGEYAQTILHMMENVQNQLRKIDKETIITQQKLNDIKITQKTIIENRTVKCKERAESEFLLYNIENEIERYNQLIYEQEMKKMKLTNSTLKKESKLAQLKDNIKEESKTRKEEIEEHKKTTIQMIRDYQYKKEKKKQRENEYINLILGLNFFQKYFIIPDKNNQSLDTEALKKTTEYKSIISGEQFSVVDDSDETKVLNTENTAQQTSPHKSASKKKKKRKMLLSEIKKQFDELTLTYEEVNNYYSKMISAEKFTRQTMTNLNKKQIELETKKEKYSKKVNEIIKKDYKNFDDLIKNNERFRQFMENNKSLMEKANKIRAHTYTNQVTNLLTEDEKTHPDKKELDKTSNIFIVKCNHTKSDIKYYIESMIKSMKECHYFKEIDDLEEEQIDNKITIYSKFLDNSSNCFKRYDLTSHQQYLKDLLLFAKKNNIENAERIYGYLFEMPKSDKYLSYFLKKDIFYDPFIFYFFNDIEKRVTLIQLIEKIISFYSPFLRRIIIQDDISHTFGTKSSKTAIPLLSDDASVKKIQLKPKPSCDNFPGSTKHKNNSSKQKLLFYKNYISKEENSDTEQAKRVPTLEEQINNEYNYDKSDSDDEGKKEKKTTSSRPMTSSTLSSNSNIMKKLYDPSLQKSKYLRDIRSGMGRIQKDTSRYRAAELNFRRSWRDVDEIKNYFFVYNDPSKIFHIIFLYRN